MRRETRERGEFCLRDAALCNTGTFFSHFWRRRTAANSKEINYLVCLLDHLDTNGVEVNLFYHLYLRANARLTARAHKVSASMDGSSALACAKATASGESNSGVVFTSSTIISPFSTLT
jgi:hypothetical protein